MPQFKAFDSSRKVMADVFGMDIPNKILVTFTPEEGRKYWAGDHIILVRCTGLADEKDKLIYEWDIVEQSFQNEFGSFTPGFGIVTWNKEQAGFQVEYKGMVFGIGLKCRRVGSHLLNPEILEEAIKKGIA